MRQTSIDSALYVSYCLKAARVPVHLRMSFYLRGRRWLTRHLKAGKTPARRHLITAMKEALNAPSA